MPAQSPATELDAQYRVLRDGTGVLLDDSVVWIAARGDDAAEYLEGQLTNEIEALEVGSGTYAALLDRKGRIQSDMRVLRLAADEFLIEVPEIAASRVLAHLDRFKVASHVGFEELGNRALVRIAGPGAIVTLGAPPLAEHQWVAQSIANTEALVIGSLWGADVLLGSAAADDAIAAIGESGGERVEPEALEIIRVEAGVPRYGHDMDGTTIPQEAGLNERAVSFTKGCYVGQETVARLHYKGKPNRHLRRLVLEAPVGAGEAVANDDRELGTIGTSVLSPARGPLALAILRREAEPGDRVVVGEAGIGAGVEEIK